jgi:hypothetical protein
VMTSRGNMPGFSLSSQQYRCQAGRAIVVDHIIANARQRSWWIKINKTLKINKEVHALDTV